MRKGTIALIAALLALLGAAGWYAYQGLIVPGEAMPRDRHKKMSTTYDILKVPSAKLQGGF